MPFLRPRRPTPFLLAVILLLGLLRLAPAQAITFVDEKPAPVWRNIQTPNSTACEMASANGQALYVGQCQGALPHGRGLLITPAKGIQGAKMDKGVAFALSPPELLQDTRVYDARAAYLQGFHRIGWTEERFDSLPAPMDSPLIPVAQQFIGLYTHNDPDGLVPLARQLVRQATARAHAKAWQYVETLASSGEVARYIHQWQGQPDATDMARAEAIGRQRWRGEYDQAFQRVDDIRSAQVFIGTYANQDPDQRLPAVRKKLAAYEAEAREMAELKARARAAFLAREAANPACVAQRKTCLAQCQGWGESTRFRCEVACESIRCD